MRLQGPLEWPVPPFAPRMPWSDDDAPMPVTIETPRGYEVDGQMLGFDVMLQSLIFRFDEDGRSLRVDFRRLRRVTLRQPLVDATARQTFASHLRKFRVALTGGGAITGRTAGHVETRAGLYLFTPDENEYTLHRAFVPTASYTRCVLGPSVEEEAALRWIGRPRDLADALDAGTLRRKVLAIGEAIHDLGLVSARQLAVALTRQVAHQRVPLGELLVTEGLLSRADLRTALGHKMGYPLVDLRHFDLEAAALRCVPLDVAFECNALPLLLHGRQLVVAVDNLARVAQLGALPATVGLKIVPVLARRQHIAAALVRAHREFGSRVWNETQRAWKHTAPMPA
jgi:hypothetical protein